MNTEQVALILSIRVLKVLHSIVRIKSLTDSKVIVKLPKPKLK